MLIAYFDEVKFQKGRSPFYWLGAIVADATLIWNLERQLDDLAVEVFGRRTLAKNTEFHAADIMNAHEHFEGWAFERRIEVLKNLTTIFGTAKNLGKIYVKMDPERMVSSDVEGMAFMFLVERIDIYLRDKQSPGMLIGDRESESVAGIFAETLSSYRDGGTKFHYRRDLTHLIDTVHFTHSHHSRMLQLADLHTWLRQLRTAGDNGKWHRKQIVDHIASIDDCLSPNKYKEWPTKDSWIKVSPLG